MENEDLDPVGSKPASSSDPTLWRQAFTAEWLRLCEGRAVRSDVADLAAELYSLHRERDAAEVAREAWGPER